MEPIKVWMFKDAPRELRALSRSGGEGGEDWFVLIPSEYTNKVLEYGLPFWMEGMDASWDPEVIGLDDGSVVVIASHA